MDLRKLLLLYGHGTRLPPALSSGVPLAACSGASVARNATASKDGKDIFWQGVNRVKVRYLPRGEDRSGVTGISRLETAAWLATRLYLEPKSQPEDGCCYMCPLKCSTELGKPVYCEYR